MSAHAVEITPDFRLNNFGSLFTLVPLNDGAREWAEETLYNPNEEDGTPMMWAGGYVIEPRFIEAVYEGLTAEGLVIV